MFKTQWMLLASWTLENNKHRVILKPRENGINLIDVTIDSCNVDEIIKIVVNNSWTTNELIDYLDQNKNRYQESICNNFPQIPLKTVI